MYTERKSLVEQLSERYGWPLKIRARDEVAHLVGLQPLVGGEVAPIYRFPGGDSVVSRWEMVPAEEG